MSETFACKGCGAPCMPTEFGLCAKCEVETMTFKCPCCGKADIWEEDEECPECHAAVNVPVAEARPSEREPDDDEIEEARAKMARLRAGKEATDAT